MVSRKHHALQVFHRALRDVPAYRDFLGAQGFSRRGNSHANDFSSVPLTEKKNYIHRYPLLARCPRKFTPDVIYASSGSSGVPTYWFSSRFDAQEAGRIHEDIVRHVWGISQTERTLVIICFSMGVWIAGQNTRQAFLELAKRGYQLTVISPGYAKDDILSILKHIAPEYRNVVIAGHPPFVMDVMQEAKRRGVTFPAQRKFFLTAGDKSSEEWRETLLSLLDGGDVLKSVVNVYGSTDAGMMAHETGASILIRRESRRHRALREALFGTTSSFLPGLFQYHPDHIFFEEVGGELVLTVDTAAPLIRYNIHDRGRIISYKDMLLLLQRLGLTYLVRQVKRLSLGLPFLVVEGRVDVAATFYALHVYPEHLNAGLEHRSVGRLVSGTYLSYIESVRRGKSQRFHIELELAKGVKSTRNVEEALRTSIVQQLIKLNIEYRKLYEWIGTKALPVLHLHPFGSVSFAGKQVKGFVRVIGKKAKMITTS